MAYVFQQVKSPYWIAGFRDSTGKRINRSTRIPVYPPEAEPSKGSKGYRENRLKALQVADSFEKAARGELVRETQIRAVLAELIEAVGGPRVASPSVADFLHKWLEDSERAGKSKTTLLRYTQAAREFRDYMGERSRAPVEEVTPEDIKRFLGTLANRGLATKTISNTLKILRIPFAEAVRMGTLPSNPALAVKPPAVVSVERGVFEAGEIRAVLEATADFENGPEWRTAIMFGYYCAMRLGDATALRWESIDFARRCVSFVPEKTRKSRKRVEIPLHPSLEEYLLALPLPENPRAHVTPSLVCEAGQRPKLSKIFLKLLARAGVNNPKESTSTGGRAVSTKSFHALRHSLASHLARAGVSAEIRMKFTGHDSLNVHAGYTHLELDSLRAAIEQLPQ